MTCKLIQKPSTTQLQYLPTTSATTKIKQTILAIVNFLLAFLFENIGLNPWQWTSVKYVVFGVSDWKEMRGACSMTSMLKFSHSQTGPLHTFLGQLLVFIEGKECIGRSSSSGSSRRGTRSDWLIMICILIWFWFGSIVVYKYIGRWAHSISGSVELKRWRNWAELNLKIFSIILNIYEILCSKIEKKNATNIINSYDESKVVKMQRKCLGFLWSTGSPLRESVFM